MSGRLDKTVLVALYVAVAAILLGLLVKEFSRDRFGDCMSVGAFSRAECEEYARE